MSDHRIPPCQFRDQSFGGRLVVRHNVAQSFLLVCCLLDCFQAFLLRVTVDRCAPIPERRSVGVDSTRGSIHWLGGGRLGCFRESRGRCGGTQESTRRQRSGASNAEEAPPVRLERLVVPVVCDRIPLLSPATAGRRQMVARRDQLRKGWIGKACRAILRKHRSRDAKGQVPMCRMIGTPAGRGLSLIAFCRASSAA